MSERKTAEIKFRCTPSFKAGLAASAAAAEQSMSEYIESAVWARQTQGRRGASSEEGSWAVGDEHERFAVPVAIGSRFSLGAPTCRCRSWEFCPHKANA